MHHSNASAFSQSILDHSENDPGVSSYKNVVSGLGTSVILCYLIHNLHAKCHSIMQDITCTAHAFNYRHFKTFPCSLICMVVSPSEVIRYLRKNVFSEIKCPFTSGIIRREYLMKARSAVNSTAPYCILTALCLHLNTGGVTVRQRSVIALGPKLPEAP